MEDLDADYEEYLWGESSPRAFARKAQVNSAATRSSRKTVVDVARLLTR